MLTAHQRPNTIFQFTDGFRLTFCGDAANTAIAKQDRMRVQSAVVNCPIDYSVARAHEV